MKLSTEQYKAIRRAIASIPGDVSNDAVGANVAKLDDMFAPESHSDALDPCAPIVLGSRGSGKSFWSSVLGQTETRKAAANAYPRLGLIKADVQFGYTGVGGANGVTQDHIDDLIAPEGTIDDAKAFWWATILSAISRQASAENAARVKPKDYIDIARNWEQREDFLIEHEQRLQTEDKTLLVVYDALDTVARTWPRRRLLTEALLEVVWAMRAYRHIRLKLFLRPDQIHDDALRFVELPKLRTGAVKLEWSGEDLYGLLFSRLALTREPESKLAFKSLLEFNGLTYPDEPSILTRQWSLVSNKLDQKRIMEAMAGQYMGQGAYAYKKGNTYDWPISHLADAFAEVTPRSFLGMMIAAARYKEPPEDKVITADGIRHGLREASKTRVDQLQQEFPWIKGVLAPLAGLLLPQPEKGVIQVWQGAFTIEYLLRDAEQHNYLPPFPPKTTGGEEALCLALQRIGVMSRRNDDRIDMPDLFRVAAKLLKKGSITPG